MPTPAAAPRGATGSGAAELLPGLRIPRGSKARFTASWRSSAAGCHWRASWPRLTQPTPCSPLTAPPSGPPARTAPPPRLGALQRLRVAGRDQEGGVQVAVTGVAPAAGLEAVAPADLDDRRDRLPQTLERNDDVLADLAPAPRADGERDAVAPAPERLGLERPRGSSSSLAPSPSACATSPASRCASACEPSASAITMNAPLAGRAPGKPCAASAVAGASKYSSAATARPLPITRSIAAVPAAASAYSATTGSAACGAGISRSQAAVMIASVPSEPISRLLGRSRRRPC